MIAKNITESLIPKLIDNKIYGNVTPKVADGKFNSFNKVRITTTEAGWLDKEEHFVELAQNQRPQLARLY